MRVGDLTTPGQGRRDTSAVRVEPNRGGATVDSAACEKLAAWLRSRDIPADREDNSLEGLDAKEIGNFYLLLVAICHQTSPQGKPPLEGHVNGHRLRGWDYLSAKLQAEARKNTEILSPAVWARITGQQVRDLFRDHVLGDRLSDPEHRATLIQDLGGQMRRCGWSHVDRMHELTQGRIATGATNLLGLLSKFRAYDDPVHKKSYFFLALMRNSGLWNYADPEQLGAPVDYHEVRGHLRIGTIQIGDPELRAVLASGGEVTAEQDISIRRAVLDALMIISERSGLRNPSQLHYLFWNVFRSCCTRETPHCDICPDSCRLPERYVPLALHPDGVRRCPFAGVCRSAGSAGKLRDYRFDTDYY